jgi:hypothetical protein
VSENNALRNCELEFACHLGGCFLHGRTDCDGLGDVWAMGQIEALAAEPVAAASIEVNWVGRALHMRNVR